MNELKDYYYDKGGMLIYAFFVFFGGIVFGANGHRGSQCARRDQIQSFGRIVSIDFNLA